LPPITARIAEGSFEARSVELRVTVPSTRRRKLTNGAKTISPKKAGFTQKRSIQTQIIKHKALICNKLVGPEGQRFLQEINTLADGSPSRFLRILSYGLANLRTMNATNYRLRDIADVAAGRQELPGSE
jgi:hypothetical protein